MLSVKRIISFLFAVLMLCSSVCFAGTVIPDGAIGIWEVNDLGTKTPVYKIQEKPNYKDIKEIVDAPNSAYLYDYGVAFIVIDHLNSNINGYRWNVSKITVDSMAYFYKDGKTEAYQCYMVCRAKNWGLFYKVNGEKLLPEDDTEIWCSCCTPEGNSYHYVAMFKFVGSW